MGIWSEPIGVYCKNIDGSKISGKDVTLLFDEDSAALALNVHSEIKAEIASTTTPISFEDSIMAACSCAKIYGYLTKPELRAWDAYFEALMNQNPRVKRAEAHFFCQDNNQAYYARKNRGDDTAWMSLPRGNLACYKLEYNKAEEGECSDERPIKLKPELVFDREAYKTLITQKRSLLNLLSENVILFDFE